MKKITGIYLVALLVILTGTILLYSIRDVLLPFFLALILAYIIHPVVNKLKAQGISNGWAVLLIYAILAIILYLGLFCAIPLIIRETASFSGEISFLWQKMMAWYNNFSNQLPVNMQSMITQFIDISKGKIAQATANTFAYLVNAVKNAAVLLLTPVLCYYMLRDKEMFKKKIVALIPERMRAETLRLAGDINHLLKQFIYGYLSISFLVGIVALIGFLLIRLKYAFLFGLIVGIGDLIPYFGPWIAAIPVVIFAFSQGKILGVWSIVILLIVQQVESVIITPKIIGNRIGLHPLTVIFLVLAGAYWLGIVGMILAVPFFAVLKMSVLFAYNHLVSWKEN